MYNNKKIEILKMSNFVVAPNVPTAQNAKTPLPTWASSLLISLGLSVVLTGILWGVFYGISSSKTKKNISQLESQFQPKQDPTTFGSTMN